MKPNNPNYTSNVSNSANLVSRIKNIGAPITALTRNGGLFPQNRALTRGHEVHLKPQNCWNKIDPHLG
uniref:Uncharacterized protein n=1 Tax=Arundo donax TaxID=35708 RepID=A0A0A9HI23_ARUDO